MVIPTYNEKDNIGLLLEQIFSLGISDLSVLVVDDNSPDGTAEVAEEYGRKFPIRVLRRPKKQGIGKAYAEGFKKVLLEKPDFIIQMDADFSHDPRVIPRFLEKIKNCDLVLGSRYIPGGGIENWNWLRRFISYSGNLYARLILGVKIKDLTGGFKCFRREVLEKINLKDLNSVGYCFQIETTYKILKKGFRVCEIPITFTERRIGASKFNLGIILESFIKVFLMRFHG